MLNRGTKFSVFSIALLLGFALFFELFGLPKVSGSIQTLFAARSPALDDLEFIERYFGRNLVDFILLPLPGGIGDEEQEQLSELEERIVAISEIRSVYSPLRALREPKPPLRLINGGWGRFILELPANLSDSERRRLDRSIQEILPAGSIRSGSFFASQVAVTTLEKEGQIRAPLCLLGLFLFVSLTFRSARMVIAVLAPPIISLAIVGATLSVLEHPVGPIAQIFPPLLLAIGSSYSAYLASRLHSASPDNRPAAMRGFAQSLILATTTTVIGFLSLLWMETEAVSDFALIMTLGSLLSALLTWVLVPRLAISRGMAESSAAVLSPRPAFFAAAALLAFGLGAFLIRVDTVPLDFFPDPSEARDAIHEAQRVFPGSHVLSVAFEFPNSISASELKTLDSFEQSVRGLHGVAGVVGAPEFARFWTKLKELDLTSGTFLSELGPRSITTEASLQARVIVENDFEGAALSALAAQLHKLAQDVGARRVAIGSIELVMAEQSSILTEGLLNSVLSALIVVGVLLLALSRSLKLAAIGLVPSVLPILGIFGALGLLHGTVNLGAALVAACSLGLISDYTFHLIMLWRSGTGLQRAVDLSYEPFVLTCLTLIVGFFPTVLSPVGPVRSFGIFLGLSLSIGIYLNLTLLPALISKLRAGSDGVRP